MKRRVDERPREGETARERKYLVDCDNVVSYGVIYLCLLFGFFFPLLLVMYIYIYNNNLSFLIVIYIHTYESMLVIYKFIYVCLIFFI